MTAPMSTVARLSLSAISGSADLSDRSKGAHPFTLELVASVDLVVARDHDVVEVDVDGDAGDAEFAHDGPSGAVPGGASIRRPTLARCLPAISMRNGLKTGVAPAVATYALYGAVPSD